MKTPDVFTRFWADLKRKEFIPLKFLYFLIFGGGFSLIPFLSIQARALGIRGDEFGTIAGILPLFGIIFSAVAGMVADKIGNFKLFLSFALVASGLTALIFLAVPIARITYHLPESLPMELNCTSLGKAEVKVNAPYYCHYKTTEGLYSYARVTECDYVCADQRVVFTIPSELDQRLCSIIPACSGSDNQKAFLEKRESSSNSTLFNETLVQQNYIPIKLVVSERNNKTRINTMNSCPDFTKLGLSSTTYTTGTDHETREDSCKLTCKVEGDRGELCSNEVSVVEKNPTLTIVLYVLCLMLQQITLISSLPLFEGATIAILKEKNGDIGLQRLYANLGRLSLTPVSAALIDLFSTEEETNFKPAIYMYCFFNVLSAVCISFIDLKFKKPAKNITKEFKHLLANFEVLIFLLISLVSGIGTGVIDTFLFWLLEDMGASNSLMGITVTVGSTFGVFILVFASSIVSRIGHINTLSLGLLFFAFRLIGYSLIRDPWLAMPFEAMECFTTALYGVAQASYITFLSTSTTIVSLQGLSVGISHGMGRGIGAMMGGFISKALGLRVTYRIMALICGCFAVGYVALNILVFRRKPRERKDTDDASEESENFETGPKENREADLNVEKIETDGQDTSAL